MTTITSHQGRIDSAVSPNDSSLEENLSQFDWKLHSKIVGASALGGALLGNIIGAIRNSNYYSENVVENSLIGAVVGLGTCAFFYALSFLNRGLRYKYR